MLPIFCRLTGAPAVTSGVWTALNNQPSFFASAGAYLLTDGRVLVEDAQLTDDAWWTLTPDNTGSYINGSWTQVASPGPCPNGKSAGSTMYAPLYYASAVLADGRFVMIGGEYDYNYTYVNGSGEVWTDQGAIYDPVANSWTCIAPPAGWTQIGDAQSAVLADGTFMIANPFNNQVATLNASTSPPTFNAPFTPAGKTSDSFNDEEGWILLPNGNVFTTEVWNSNDATETPALTYSPVSKAWSSAGIAPDPLVLLTKGGTTYEETGPAMLRPDGTVFATGAVGFNDIYDTVGGTWSSGPSFPTITGTYSGGSCNTVGVTEQLVMADAPAALLPDGNVLVAPGPVDSQSACEWVPPTKFFEFDGTNLTQVAESTVAPQVPSYVGRLLVLPTGQVLYTNSAGVHRALHAGGKSQPVMGADYRDVAGDGVGGRHELRHLLARSSTACRKRRATATITRPRQIFRWCESPTTGPATSSTRALIATARWRSRRAVRRSRLNSMCPPASKWARVRLWWSLTVSRRRRWR